MSVFAHVSPAPVTPFPPTQANAFCPGVTICRSLPNRQAGRVPLLCARLAPLAHVRLSPRGTQLLEHLNSRVPSKAAWVLGGWTDRCPFSSAAVICSRGLFRAHSRPVPSFCRPSLGCPLEAIIIYHLTLSFAHRRAARLANSTVCCEEVQLSALKSFVVFVQF